MRMRIAFVVTGGVDRSGRDRVVPNLLWLVERLARIHNLHVFALHYYPEPCSYPLLGATVHDIGRVEAPPGFRRALQSRRLSAAIAAHGPFDLLHAYQGMPAATAAPVATRLGLPFIVTFDSGEFVSIDDIQYGLQRRWVDRRAVATAIRAADRLTVSTAFMARMAASGPTAPPPAVIPIGIDRSLFPVATRTDGPPWRLLRVASINPVKDYPTLLRAVARLAALGLDVRLDIVGEDTLNGVAQAQASALGLEFRVAFHGVQPTDRLAAFYAAAHLHVVSSRHEAAGVTILEAAATGLPTVGTAVGYIADWQEDRAVAVPVNDPDALAGAISDLLRDPARRTRVAAAARTWTLAHDADWTAQQFDRLYAGV
jgi:glycosyltransferase involved in cell wall biosynthesis